MRGLGGSISDVDILDVPCYELKCTCAQNDATSLYHSTGNSNTLVYYIVSARQSLLYVAKHYKTVLNHARTRKT